MAPAGTPKEVTDKIYAETMRVLAQPDVRKQFAVLGIDVIGGTPAEFAAVIATETGQWAKLIKAMGIGVIE
jgi:tripartite-type tricarboxylate transporter receptor subunit TctC